MSGIDVISSSIIGMASDAPPISRLELSPFDLRLLLLDPIQRGILFRNPKFHKIDIPRLKTSLSRTLDFFPPLAGRLGSTAHGDGTTSFFMDCNNAGVEFTHAVADGISVSDIIDPNYIPEIVPSLFTLNGIPNYEGVSNPLIGVQVTELADGLFIACTANHAAIDGVSFWHFLNSWSEITRGCTTISKRPVFERLLPTTVDGGPIRLPPLEKNLWRSFARPPLLERVFHFSKESVAKLKAKANGEAGTNRISSLQALSAHLWRSSMRCRQGTGGGEAGFMMSVSARARIPLPDGYFGNAAYGARTAISEAELLQKGLGNTALKINEFVASHTKECVEKFVSDWAENPKLHGKGGYSFFISSSPRHNVYGNDFGWGKPIAVRRGNGQKVDGMVTVYPAAEAGGIDAEVFLAPEVMRAMEADQEFMEAFTIGEYAYSL
ncbi:uncharacterized acetyltransferase At3g50280-like [Salvia miltiorrhiza]|uniref:uncharacterized acetyltransferase At3g50280-like n=1 Tax=Salvia miltiorrhiza TaxID=226208 RepID=UPI0025AC39F7|nr:uncharacterized acetyltransferase At3g50280-like [Salvia miltiorrhiza]